MSKFEEQYFKNLNYSNYLEHYGRYLKMAEELYFYLTKFDILSKSTKILDYGCSVGFLIKAFKKIKKSGEKLKHQSDIVKKNLKWAGLSTILHLLIPIILIILAIIWVVCCFSTPF